MFVTRERRSKKRKGRRSLISHMVSISCVRLKLGSFYLNLLVRVGE